MTPLIFVQNHTDQVCTPRKLQSIGRAARGGLNLMRQTHYAMSGVAGRQAARAARHQRAGPRRTANITRPLNYG